MTDERLTDYFDDFGQQLLAATPGSTRRRFAFWRGGHRVLLVAGLSVGGVTAAALAASGLLSGDPVKSEYGAAVSPHEGKGVPVAAASSLSPLRVADPAGGLPWGLRIVKTTRNTGCVQVGRVLNGKLGYLGQDGAFGNDGLFHPLPDSVLDDASCQPLDGAGRLFIAMSAHGIPASGSARDCLVDRRRHKATGEAAKYPPRCPAEDLRVIFYGQAGPRATAVSYPNAAGQLRRARTAGPDGAYLVVLPVAAGHSTTGTFVPTNSPGSGLRSVSYEDSPTCQIPDPRRLGGARLCPLVGYTPPARSRLTSDDVRSRVQAEISNEPVVPTGADAPRGGPVRAQWRLTVSFSAPVSTQGVQSYYLVTVRGERGPICQSVLGAPVTRDVAKGERVKLRYYIQAHCYGESGGTVTLHQAPADPALQDQMPYAPRVTKDDLTVGNFAFEIPKRRP